MVAGTVLRAPFTARTARELLCCLSAAATAACVIGAVLAVPVGLHEIAAYAARHPAGSGRPPVGVRFLQVAFWSAVVLAAVLVPRLARGLVGLLQRVAGQPHLRLPAWRAVAYLLARLPVAILAADAVFCWVVGLVNLTYPLWWTQFRNHPPQVQLDPVPVLTPIGSFPVSTARGSYAAFATGLAMVLAAPWLARVANTADRALMRGLLAPGRLAQRVADLEQTRAQAVDDAAALVRRLERDLHDGAQVQLAALAMTLGRIKEKLGQGDLVTAGALVDAAHGTAKDALAELRDLVRGIHPPVLDNGLADALATLAARSALPVRLEADIPVRPSPAVETIAYFCAAELLANAAKHSHAGTVTMRAARRDAGFRLTVADDGVGGADPGRGSGLAGLAGRVRTVDGQMDITSPPGGPTRITVDLPLRA